MNVEEEAYHQKVAMLRRKELEMMRNGTTCGVIQHPPGIKLSLCKKCQKEPFTFVRYTGNRLLWRMECLGCGKTAESFHKENAANTWNHLNQ